MNFAQAQAYLQSTVGEVASPRHTHRLDRMRAFLEHLDNPQNRYPTIQIGGTSGKGSTATMVASVLSVSGRKTGLHTKPHLHSMVERARIDGVNVSEERFAELLTEMMPAIDAVASDFTRPSYYETLLALTFLYFAQEEVDLAVIEVGIGGRLDGTNVLTPRVCAITTVGLDHTDILGETIEEIARDKAGIAKAGVPLATAAEHAGARAIIQEACVEAGAPFVSVLDAARIQEGAVVTQSGRYEVSLPVLGPFQRINAATAIVLLEQLTDDLRPSKQQIEAGLSRVALPGRMEYFQAHPGIVFDIAHNPDKAANLSVALASAFPGRRFTFVIAIGESKDAGDILRAFAELPATFLFTQFRTEGRSATKPQRLASIAESLGLWGRAIADPIEALSIARRNASADDIVVVTGSTYVVGELREWWIEHVAAARA
jgi:dihydrofolate synthase/folylpolyglutamate synthase